MQWKLQGRMFSTFDRYLIWRVLHTFAMLFIATYGLYVVIDLFMNIDEFQENSLKGLAAGESGRQLELFRRIGVHYLYRAFDFFELAGSILVVVSTIAVLALIRKSSETFPLLAAGVPAWRLLRPLLVTTAGLNLLLVINQELVIPHLAVQLQTPRGSQIASIQQVEPVYDYSNYMMHISGDQVLLDKRLIIGATFAVNATELSSRPFVMKAERARYVKDRTRSGRSGWLLEDLTAVLDSEILTGEGRKRITPSTNGRDAFVESNVTFEQLYNRGRNMRLLSSWELVQQIQNPSTG
ncbi:MAG: LptF/LptG family permease, partial [Planctomycetaceae bacterium]